MSPLGRRRRRGARWSARLETGAAFQRFSPETVLALPVGLSDTAWRMEAPDARTPKGKEWHT